MSEQFTEGQIFVGEYTPEAAIWCNESGNHYIEEIEKDDEGNRRFRIVKIPDPTAEEIAERVMAEKKAERAVEVNSIVVSVDGMDFDGDEDAQRRMTVAISTARAKADKVNASSETKENYLDYQTTWVLADNTIATVTIAQLVDACMLAGQKQTELWTKPYEG